MEDAVLCSVSQPLGFGEGRQLPCMLLTYQLFLEFLSYSAGFSLKPQELGHSTQRYKEINFPEDINFRKILFQNNNSKILFSVGSERSPVILSLTCTTDVTTSTT